MATVYLHTRGLTIPPSVDDAAAQSAQLRGFMAALAEFLTAQKAATDTK